MAHVDLDAIEAHLEPGERVLWSARPEVGVRAHLRHAGPGDLLFALITGAAVIGAVVLLCAGVVAALAVGVLALADALAWDGMPPRVQQVVPWAVLVPSAALLIALGRSAAAPPSWASARYAATSHGRGVVVHPLGVTLFRLPRHPSGFEAAGEHRELELRLDEPARLVERARGAHEPPDDLGVYQAYGWTGERSAVTLAGLPDPARDAQELRALGADSAGG